jgi:nitroimidazol reductase NimA-like FMN-containing flavoprotein (pyridoxamine 5'-phosphate oxidase superfamily)
MNDQSAPPSERTRVRRLHERGRYDRATIDAILDAQPLAHVGTVVDGLPVVTPTLQWREGDHVYWHGSAASRMLRAAEGREVCLTATLLDGLVLARSAFHHSVNYRSVMLFGRAEKVSDPEEKAARLRYFLDGLYPGRWEQLRPMTAQELKATTVLSMPIDEASAKVRTGPPVDDEDDYALPIWAGVVPVRLALLEAEADPRNRPDVAQPAPLPVARIG